MRKKRKIIIAMTIVLISLSAFFFALISPNEAVFYQNLEALTIIEEGKKGEGKCWYTSNAVENQLMLVCVSCIYIQADPVGWSAIGNCPSVN